MTAGEIGEIGEGGGGDGGSGGEVTSGNGGQKPQVRSQLMMKLSCLHLVILSMNDPTAFWQYSGSLGVFLSRHGAGESGEGDGGDGDGGGEGEGGGGGGVGEGGGGGGGGGGEGGGRDCVIEISRSPPPDRATHRCAPAPVH